MSYRATSESSDQTPEERTTEARKIIVEMGLQDHLERMTSKEADFVERLANDLTYREVGFYPVSIKQLWWLRDLKDKYLL